MQGGRGGEEKKIRTEKGMKRFSAEKQLGMFMGREQWERHKGLDIRL